MKSQAFGTHIALTVCTRSNCVDWPENQPQNIEISLAKKLGVMKKTFIFSSFNKLQSHSAKTKVLEMIFGVFWGGWPRNNRNQCRESKGKANEREGRLQTQGLQG